MPRAARARHRLEDHRVAVAGDQLVGRELVQQAVEQREVLRGLRAIGPRLVVVARQQQRDRHALDGVVHDGPVCDARLLLPLVAVDGLAARAPGASTPCSRRCSSIVNVTALSKRAVVRMRHSWPASASHSMIVRRLCVTPAVGSLMQWLLTRRKRTPERTGRESTASTVVHHPSITRSPNMSHEAAQVELKEKTQQSAAGIAEARPRRRPCRSADAAGGGGGEYCRSPEPALRRALFVVSSGTTRTATASRMPASR